MATENTTNKKVTLEQMKKACARSKAETDKAISASGGSGEVATDAEVDAMLDEVFGTGITDPAGTDPSGTEGGEA